MRLIELERVQLTNPARNRRKRAVLEVLLRSRAHVLGAPLAVGNRRTAGESTRHAIPEASRRAVGVADLADVVGLIEETSEVTGDGGHTVVLRVILAETSVGQEVRALVVASESVVSISRELSETSGLELLLLLADDVGDAGAHAAGHRSLEGLGLPEDLVDLDKLLEGIATAARLANPGVTLNLERSRNANRETAGTSNASRTIVSASVLDHSSRDRRTNRGLARERPLVDPSGVRSDVIACSVRTSDSNGRKSGM